MDTALLLLMTAWGMKKRVWGPASRGACCGCCGWMFGCLGKILTPFFLFFILVWKEKVQAGLVWGKSSGRLGPRVRTSVFFPIPWGFSLKLSSRMHCCGFLYVFLGGAIIPQEGGAGTL